MISERKGVGIGPLGDKLSIFSSLFQIKASRSGLIGLWRFCKEGSNISSDSIVSQSSCFKLRAWRCVMKTKALSLFVSIVFVGIGAVAQEAPPVGGPHRGMPPELKAQLTTEQQATLEAAATMEEKRQLLQAWGIKMPKPPGRGGPGGPGGPRGLPPEVEAKLTDKQKEQLAAAKTFEEKRRLLSLWGIELPPPPERPDEVTMLSKRYSESASLEQQQAIRKQLKQIFYAADTTDDMKNRIRAFFRDNPEISSGATQTIVSSTGAAN